MECPVVAQLGPANAVGMNISSCEINGRLIRMEQLSVPSEKAALQNAIDAAVARVRSIFSPDELPLISIRLSGSSVDDLEMDVNGPDYLMEKFRDSLYGES